MLGMFRAQRTAGEMFRHIQLEIHCIVPCLVGLELDRIPINIGRLLPLDTWTSADALAKHVALPVGYLIAKEESTWLAILLQQRWRTNPPRLRWQIGRGSRC